MYKVAELRKKSEPILDYLENSKDKTTKFMERFHSYVLDQETADKIREHAGDAVVVVFSAEWCPDCHRNLPVLGLIHEATGLEVMVFGQLMRDTKSNTRKWAVPPSPPEVEEFNVTKIPSILVLSLKGEKIGEIIENPPQGKTLEQAILEAVEA
jgi:thiol-disulfide isomerase/thioredoxin